MGMYRKIKNFNSVRFLLLLFVVFPILTYAYDPLTGANDAPVRSVVTTPTNFKEAVMLVVNLITALLPVIILLAFIYFLWGLLQYLKNAGENKDEAKHMMISGVIGFFIMSSVWGLVNIMSATVGTKPVKPDLGEAEQYLTNEGVSGSLKEHQDELLRGLGDDLKKGYKDPKIPGYSQSSEKGDSVTVTVEGEGEKNKVPGWFSNLLPWNWFESK